MIQLPPGMGKYQFVVIATLRAAQLMRGCIPRVDAPNHKPIVVAQLEVAEGKVVQLINPLAAVIAPVAV